MSHPLVAVKSCLDHRDREQAQQDTWASYRTIWFNGPMLRVPDDYEYLPFKTQAICRWVLKTSHTHCFLCDTDTYVALDRLLQSDYAEHDYVGYRLEGSYGNYASGGAGYWLSRAAMEVLSEAPCARGNEDEWAGTALRFCSIPLRHDPRYALYQDCLPTNDVISRHLSSREPFKIEMMAKAHELYSSSKG